MTQAPVEEQGGLRFFVGMHHPADARHFGRCMVSANVLRRRKAGFPAREWILDSGAFTEVTRFGGFREPVAAYANQVVRWAEVGRLAAAVAQDWMCEPLALRRTGLTVLEHQGLTLDRYDELRARVPGGIYVMPVLQGYEPAEYLRHLGMYGARLMEGAWVGVGSICKRNSDLPEIERVLVAINRARPDLRLHGFGVKLTALASSLVRGCLWSADSMAWSYRARVEGRDGNDWREARAFVGRIEGQVVRTRHFQAGLWDGPPD